MAGSVNLKSTISLDDSAFVSGMKKVGRATAIASKKASAAFRSVGGSIAKAVTRLKNFAAIIAKISLVGIGAGIAAAGVAVSKLVKAGSGMAAQYETIRLTMGAYLKDLGQADTILDQIAKFSVVTPFETTGLQDATNTLLGAGIAGEEVVGVLKEISAVSKTTGQVGELADALSKGFAKGKFQTEELNKFLERGINLMPELERVTGKSGEALQKAIQKGLKFEDVRTAIANLSREGGLFFGMLETQSTTFSGLISTLSSNWDEFLLKFGQPINDSLKPLLDIFIQQVQRLTKSGAQIGTVISTAIDGVVNKIKGVDFVGLGQKFIAGLDIEGAKNLLMSAAKVVAAFFGNKLVEAIRIGAHLFKVAFDHVAKQVSGAFGDTLKKEFLEIAKFAVMPPPLAIAKLTKKIKEGLNKANEEGVTLEDKLLSAADALKNKVTKDSDPFGLQAEAEAFKEALEGIMEKGRGKLAGGSESNEYDAELAAQKARVKRDEEKARAAKAQKAADLSKINDFLTGSVPDHVSANMPLKADPGGRSAWQKLQGSTNAFDLLQGRKAQGIAVGASTSLSQNGMGVKRYTNPAREAARIAKEQKKDARDQTEILRDVDKKLEQGLAVN